MIKTINACCKLYASARIMDSFGRSAPQRRASSIVMRAAILMSCFRDATSCTHLGTSSHGAGRRRSVTLPSVGQPLGKLRGRPRAGSRRRAATQRQRHAHEHGQQRQQPRRPAIAVPPRPAGPHAATAVSPAPATARLCCACLMPAPGSRARCTAGLAPGRSGPTWPYWTWRSSRCSAELREFAQGQPELQPSRPQPFAHPLLGAVVSVWLPPASPFSMAI